MNSVERIRNRLPRFYEYWKKESRISSLLRAMSKQLDEAEDKIMDVMKAHWVDLATEEELDRLATLLGLSRLSEEDDNLFRNRLKRAVDEYKGGGTVSAILEAMKMLVNAKSEDAVKIVENPRASAFAEYTVRLGDMWRLGSNSIEDAQPSITLTVEGEGEVENPQITNIDTKESIALRGWLRSGQKLVIKKKKATVDGKDVSKKISPRTTPLLLRKGSVWGYTESLAQSIGVFDRAKFDEHTFLVAVPAVRIRFDWTRLQPATFEVHVKSKALRGSGFSKPYLEKVVNSMKAAGMNAIIRISG